MSRSAAGLMIQATGSDAGKSLIVAGLCRYFARAGQNVRPFKPQNMSNNAAVTHDGGEIGRAQALQARASGVMPCLHMNPVLLKPEGETGAQIIVQGQVRGKARAQDYSAMKQELMRSVLESYDHLQKIADLIVVEGAGSPAEVNLRQGDIANMGFAEAADVPVVLVADIDRGGVIANLIGTHALLTTGERERVKGFIINKFRGDASLFDDGVRRIEQDTGWPCLGIVPWFADAARLPAEDSMALQSKSVSGSSADSHKILIAVPHLPHIANFDDLDPLSAELDVEIIWVEPHAAIPASADLILLPGSKATIADLEFLKVQGWDIDIKAHTRRGGHVLGLCGGYQMLGEWVCDPLGIEGAKGEVRGLGLLKLKTILSSDKRLANVSGTHLASGAKISGYEIHMGQTSGEGLQSAYLEVAGRLEGAVGCNGRVAGTYVHSLFHENDFRHEFLNCLRQRDPSNVDYEAELEAVLDKLADHLGRALDMSAIETIASLQAKNTALSANISAS